MQASSVKSYSALTGTRQGTTGTGLDQIVEAIYTDNGLAGSSTAGEVSTGAMAADRLNTLIVEAAKATGAAADHVFTIEDVLAINGYLRANAEAAWADALGDGSGANATALHQVLHDGPNIELRGDTAITTVFAGLYHIGFAVEDGYFRSAEGTSNVSVEQVANWLTALYSDHATTGSGLDRIVTMIMADEGLSENIPEQQIEAGADAANGMNKIIMEAVTATGVLADNAISAADVVKINAHIRANHLDEWTTLHGDDEGDEETGFHLVQNDGSNTCLFGHDGVNTVADGIYHLGFEIKGTKLLNEDGDANADIRDVANWLTVLLSDQSTSGTGLDKIIDVIMTDPGLMHHNWSVDTLAGAKAANGLNILIATGISETKAMADGWITGEDLITLNAWIKADPARFEQFLTLHGDDGEEFSTGYHRVQNDGAETDFFGRNLVNTVADGIYHIGFDIVDGRFVNEDGDENQTLSDVASWLNYFYKGATLVTGTHEGDQIAGGSGSENIMAGAGDDTVTGGGGGDLIYGSWGDDRISAGAGVDIIYGESGNDTLDGGEGGDIYRVSGNMAGGWASFHDFDTYSDTGTSGNDVIVAVGSGNVDIGVTSFGASSGIESIDGTAIKGTVRVLGDWQDNTLDFRKVNFIGGNIVIDGGDGNDTIYGTAGSDRIWGGRGDDTLNLGSGGDIYYVKGNVAGGWQSFHGYDTYVDNGTAGSDKIVACGSGNVDIGVKSFGSASGIESIDGSAAKGTVRVLGDWADNTLDFRKVTFIGGNVVIDGGDGNDTIYGTAGADKIWGGRGDDTMNLGAGSDSYYVSGNFAGGWESFHGFDAYVDNGATGTDKIIAIGAGNVDIGVKSFALGNGIESIDGSAVKGTVRVLGDWQDNILDFRKTSLIGGNVVIDGGDGNDTIYGTAGTDKIWGGRGDDTMNLGAGGDIYYIKGNLATGCFQGYDTYVDNGTTGTDKIVAVGAGNVDIGVKFFAYGNGIETIDGSAAKGIVRVLGDWQNNTLDFRKVAFVGGNVVVDAGDGNDTIYGTVGADTIWGGRGDDTLNLGAGSDVYRVSGNIAGGWESFQGFDTYVDNGTTGTDKIVASGDGDVDIGMRNFSATTGIESIDGSSVKGAVRVLGDWQSNSFDFSKTNLIGAIVIDGADGDDTLVGNAGANTLKGGCGADRLFGAAGSDQLDGGAGRDVVSGGTGADKLYGGAGSDTFVFDTAPVAIEFDSILDFTAGSDLISFDHSVFAVGAVGKLSVSAFNVGTQAADATDRIVYDATTGAVYYDADGTGTIAQVQILSVAAGTSLSAASFLVA